MLRILILLLVVGGLTLFLLSNPTPIPLVILGVQTAAVPLAVWIMGAIGAGALTTLFLAGIFQVSSLFSAPRQARASRQRSDRPSRASEQWDGGWTPQAPVDSAPYTNYATTTPNPPRGEEWSSVGRNPDEWEDWSDYSEPTPPPDPVYEPPVYDAPYSVSEPAYAPPYTPPPYGDSYAGYADAQTGMQTPDSEPHSEPDSEEWDDWDYDEEADRRYDSTADQYEDDRPARPVRTEFERKQEPKSTYRSGTIYSYSYRDNEASKASRTEKVYETDYEVVKPSQADLNPAMVSRRSTSDAEEWASEEDWDVDEEDEFEDEPFEDEFEDELERDRPRRDRPKRD